MAPTGTGQPTALLCTLASAVRPPLPLRRVLFVLIFHCLLDVAVGGLKCKCTQNSPKVACEHGMCEVSSAASACLMLDHPHSGRHYACSTSELREGECVEKRSRSGANVKVCSCNSSDFCNFKIWPDGKEEQSFGAEESDDETEESAEGDENSEEVAGEGNLKNGAMAANAPTGVVAISIGLLAFILRVICDRSNIFG